ncbi:ABC transporter permease [Neobacillus sp. NPDC093127]|uniref:ABC transporter permease n=1 Tax=Neobacillus sp. NPDC093127 TaxID=3364296 RepID=UPI0037FC4A3E
MNKSIFSKHITTNLYFELIRTVVAIVVSLVFATIIIFIVSDEPLTAITTFLTGPLQSVRSVGYVIEMTIPLIFTGLAISVMFQAKQFNLAAAGSFFMGGVIASALAIKLNLPNFIHPLVCLVAAGVIGGIICVIPAILKIKWKASELVSSLMFNYIMFFGGLFIINHYFRDPSTGIVASFEFKSTARLINLVSGTRIHVGFLIAVGMIVFCYYLLYRSKWGYEIRMTGQNLRFSEYSGIKVSKVILYSQIIGGIIAGIGGASEILGIYNRFTWTDMPSYGWDAIIVAILARNNPILVPLSAFFLAYLRIGADIMGRMTDVQSEVFAIIQGVMILLIAAESFLSSWKHRRVYRNATDKTMGEV